MFSTFLKLFFIHFLLINSVLSLSNVSNCLSVKIKEKDTCYKLWTEYNMTESAFMLLNPKINCQALQVGTSICVTPPNTVYSYKDDQNSQCPQKYSVKSGDTCYSMWTSRGLKEASFMALNQGLNCNNLQIGQEVCMGTSTTSSPIFNSPQQYPTTYVQPSANAQPIPSAYTDPQQMKYTSQYNPYASPFLVTAGGNIPSIPTSTTQPSQLVLQPQTQGSASTSCYLHTIVAGDTCFDIWSKNGMSQSDFLRLNPSINCQQLQVGQKVCTDPNALHPGQLRDDYNCQRRYSIKAGDTCNFLWRSYNISEQNFLSKNPGVNCNNLQIGQQICLS